MNINSFTTLHLNWLGIFSAFVFGLLSIHLLLKLADKVNFGLFVGLFGVLTLLSVLL